MTTRSLICPARSSSIGSKKLPTPPIRATPRSPNRSATLKSWRAIGIGDETLVVAYDDADGMFAARLWWSLNYYGHTNVVVLDGGWNKWIAEGRPTTADVAALTPATLHAARRTR